MGKKLTAPQVEEMKGLTIQQKFSLLETLEHPRMSHIKEFYVLDLDNGKFGYSLSPGTDLTVNQPLDDTKDAALIKATGKRTRKVLLPGKYVNRHKVIDTILVEDYLMDKEAIETAYDAWMVEQDRILEAKAKKRPNATARMIAAGIAATQSNLAK